MLLTFIAIRLLYLSEADKRACIFGSDNYTLQKEKSQVLTDPLFFVFKRY